VTMSPVPVARFASLAALALLALSTAAPAEGAAPVERQIEVERVTRSYLITVPTTWDRVRPIPVLFVFHGAGSDAESMVRATGFDAMAEMTNLLVVYPKAPAKTKRYDVDPARGGVSADVLFFDALLARLRERFRVDDRRVFATGFSNGAALCYRIAAERPNVVAAIAPVAGYLPALVRSDPIVPVPLLAVHGTADGRVAAPALRGDANDPVRRWATWNGATKGPEVTTLAGTEPLVVRRAAYTGPSPRADAETLLVEGEGHVWSGGPGGPVSKKIVEFLLAHPQKEPIPKPLSSR
jgi:polyhydroxybutyrate depolymerase